MKSHTNRYWYVLLVVAAVLLSAAFGLRATVARRNNPHPDLPKVISKARDIEVISVTPRGDGTVLSVVVRNNSDKAVVSIAIESGDAKDASGINISGFRGNDEAPTTVIEPRGLRTFDMPFDNLLPGKPLKVGGVMYADGTEGGEEVTLKSMRAHRDSDKAQTHEKKIPPQTAPAAQGGAKR
jgi:hypothetical protein